MIRYSLRCESGHGFEGWFRDSRAFEEQKAAGDLACPSCGSDAIDKAIMAPRIAKGAAKGTPGRPPEGKRPAEASASPEQAGSNEAPGALEAAAPADAPATPGRPSPAELRQALLALRGEVESKCDYVGPRFAEESRKIHYGETESRGIYGEATSEEAESLAEEGIEVRQIPWISRGDA